MCICGVADRWIFDLGSENVRECHFANEKFFGGLTSVFPLPVGVSKKVYCSLSQMIGDC